MIKAFGARRPHFALALLGQKGQSIPKASQSACRVEMIMG